MAFEQPNPALYIKYPPKTDNSTKTQGSNESDAALKTVSATAAKTTGGEKPRQGNTTTQPTTTSDKPDSTKDKGTATVSLDSTFLSTTLINIDGCPVTWACE